MLDSKTSLAKILAAQKNTGRIVTPAKSSGPVKFNINLLSPRSVPASPFDAATSVTSTPDSRVEGEGAVAETPIESAAPSSLLFDIPEDVRDAIESIGTDQARDDDELLAEAEAFASSESETSEAPRPVLEGEIIPPSREIADIGFDNVEAESLSYEVDADHLRRAAMRAAELFNIMAGVTITPDESQVRAVHTLANSQHGCLIGAAGTGKTTTTRMLLHVIMNGDAAAGIEPMRIQTVDMSQYHKAAARDEVDEAELREEEIERAAANRIPAIALCAFTGQATQVLRKNMPGPWKANCMTIHSMLGFAPVEFTKEDGSQSMRFEPSYDRFNKMPWDVVVVDEASMVNIDLWHQVLEASKPSTRFYFIGDLNQLPPPIGQGVLGFALAKWPVCELTVVHRQKDEAANRIVDVAHHILKGKEFQFDDPTTVPNWRVIGFELKHESAIAHQQVVQLAKVLAGKTVHPSVDPAEPQVYDPWRDRIMTPGNGFNSDDPASLLGQFPLNDSLSRIFADPTQPRIIIDAKKVTKKFAVGYRIMATKNEPPDSLNRVTNGLTGRIIQIETNPNWIGDWRLVGDESQVEQNRKAMLAAAFEKKSEMDAHNEESLDGLDDNIFSVGDLNADMSQQEKDEKQGGPASHIVTVHFDNGTTRIYHLNAQIEQLQIAYASTVHKAQGAEMPTAIIVVHHASKTMLCRENLYTAVTRASQRVILLYTPFGLRIALSKQKISGATLKEKIRNYQRLTGEEAGFTLKPIRVFLNQAELQAFWDEAEE